MPRSVVAALAGLALLFAAELSGLIPDTARKPLAAGLTLSVVVVTVLYVDRRRRSRPGQR
ncbi:hypothetical protein [Streptomyces goshikiensis]|uniref:hypothetical protein n=1 Tax=Streptomyces goshikiensis TaxID=1942 RepID=UPI003659B8D6